MAKELDDMKIGDKCIVMEPDGFRIGTIKAITTPANAPCRFVELNGDNKVNEWHGCGSIAGHQDHLVYKYTDKRAKELPSIPDNCDLTRQVLILTRNKKG